MSISNFTVILGLKDDADISDAVSGFLPMVKDYMRKAQQNPSAAHIRTEEEALRTLYKNFFSYTMHWTTEARKKYAKVANHEDAQKLRKKAAENLNELQDNIIGFALCFQRLNRAMGLVSREFLMHSKAKREEAGPLDKKIEWTSDTGKLLVKYRKERALFEESNERLAIARAALESIEPAFNSFEQGIGKLHGEQKIADIVRPIMAALRVSDFGKARKALAELCEIKKGFATDKKSFEEAVTAIQTGGQIFIDTIEAQKDNLFDAEGKLFLRTREITLMIDTQSKEIEQKKQFIAKYHQAYIENKIRSIHLLMEKLFVIGSLDSLVTLYMKLVRGLAQPLPDIKAVREYEHDVLENIKYLLGGRFQEIARIEQQVAEILAEFNESVNDFKKSA